MLYPQARGITIKTNKTKSKIANVIKNSFLYIIFPPVNDNLEQQARLLVRNWEESEPCPKSTCKIHEVAEINTLTYSAKDNWEYVNYLDTSNITNGVLHEIQHIDTTTEKLPSRAKRKVLKNDIVYSTVRPNQLHFGIISTPRDNMLVSTGFAVIRCIKSNINNEFLYLQLTEKDVIESLQQIGEQSTSTFPAVKPIDIGNIEIAFTDANDTELLNVIKNIFESISNNLQQNQKLAELRGDLLPRLMSGEIDASQIEI